MHLPEKYLREFTDYLKFQKRYSPHTITSYNTDLNAFTCFLEKQFGENDMTAVRAPYIRSWLASMKQDDLSAKSITRKISALRSFYKFLLRNDAIASNPVATIVSPKLPKRLPQFVNEKGTDDLMHIAFPADFGGMTDRLVLKLLYETGIRRSELVSLKEYNIDRANSNIKVLGKGSRERIIPMQSTLTADLFEYIREKKKLFADNEIPYLFVNEKGVQLSVSKVYSIARKYLQTVTTISKKSPHILRHSFATQLMNNGADINAVKELLGHSSLAATQVYTHNTIEKLKDIHRKAHPKG